MSTIAGHQSHAPVVGGNMGRVRIDTDYGVRYSDWMNQETT